MIVCPFQPTLFPSLYVFNRAYQADMFIMMLSAQFCAANKKEDGNKGKTGQRHMLLGGAKPVAWVGVPIERELQPIRETVLKSTNWRDTIMTELDERYSSAPYYLNYRGVVQDILRNSNTLGDLNSNCFLWGHKVFNLACTVKDDVEICPLQKGNDWVSSLVQHSGCDTLITGKPSLNYLDTERFTKVKVQDWKCPTYPQISTGWTPSLSMLDAIFNIGAEATAQLIKTN